MVKLVMRAWKATSRPTERCPSTARRPPIIRISALLSAASVGATIASHMLGTPSRCRTSRVTACWPAQRRKKPSSPPVAFIVSMSWRPLYEVLVSRAFSAWSLGVGGLTWITIRMATTLSSAMPMPTTVSCGSYVQSSTA